MSRITFNIAAKCDKAGRAQNQDNYWVCTNLDNVSDTSGIGGDQDIDLGNKGALLVVADGMGGMKSGEKASEFVIAGIKQRFANIPTDILNNDDAILDFIRKSIIESDHIIKAYAKDHRESAGMGSTIVLVWLLGEKAYCGWCGDSRIYCYNPQNSLVRLSHDHSYVQALVDGGKITEEEAFDHPDGNIITRSLGDCGEEANPETKVYPIHRHDVFLLCSDGLCGLLNDSQIETILADHSTSSDDALRALWQAGEAAGWTDNATIEVACITDGGVTPTRKAAGYVTNRPRPAAAQGRPGRGAETAAVINAKPAGRSNLPMIIGILIAVAVIAGAAYYFLFSGEKVSKGSSNQEFSIEQSGEGSDVSADQPDEFGDRPTADKVAKPDAKGKKEAPNDKTQATGPVDEQYLGVLNNTHSSIGHINQTIAKIQSKGSIAPDETRALGNFKSYAESLLSKPEAKRLQGGELAKLNAIRGTLSKVNSVLGKYKRSVAPDNEHSGPKKVIPVKPSPKPEPTHEPDPKPTNEPKVHGTVDV